MMHETSRTMTWKCHGCGKERPDTNIDVFSGPFGNGSFMYLRYCNDSSDCRKSVEDQLAMHSRAFGSVS